MEERPAAVEAIFFAADDQSQMNVIKRWIDKSDVFILGGRYGSIDPKNKKSYIQLEYEYACEIGKALFAVVITEDAIDRKVKTLNREDRTKVSAEVGGFSQDSPKQSSQNVE